MSSDLAILSGTGVLPVDLARACPAALCITFAGIDHSLTGPSEEHCFEQLGALFETLKKRGVRRVVMAGSMHRPPLNPEKFDALMHRIAPQLVAALQLGDDGLLRFVIELFETHGFVVCGAHEILPELTATAGLLSESAPLPEHLRDIDAGRALLRRLSDADIGQSTVFENGLCLGIETLQGTDAMLDFVAATPSHLRRGHRGVFIKAPKLAQDLRVDMPAIGPATIQAVQAAGLAGLAIAAGRVLVLEPEQTVSLVSHFGLFLVAQEI